jgi:hypothetical protein
VGGLHRLSDDPTQLAGERVEVDLIAESGTEAFKRLCGVVLSSEEAAVDDGLDA